MPLIKSASPQAVSTNIREMRAAGHSERQSVAAALHTADVAKRAHRADGGGLGSISPPWQERANAREMVFGGGLIKSHIAGRTDHLPMSVPAGSYVVPADIVSGLGQGNTLNGAKVLSTMFKMGMPYMHAGSFYMSGLGQSAGPMGRRLHRADGGNSGHVPIIAAGGEFVIPPEAIHGKFGDVDQGHKALDVWVKKERAKHIKTLKSLPGPAK